MLLCEILIYLFTFREREREGKWGGEKYQCKRNIYRLSLLHTPTRDWTCNPGMCPDQQLNQLPSSSRNNAQPTEPCWSGLEILFKVTFTIVKFFFSSGTRRYRKWFLMLTSHLNHLENFVKASPAPYPFSRRFSFNSPQKWTQAKVFFWSFPCNSNMQLRLRTTGIEWEETFPSTLDHQSQFSCQMQPDRATVTRPLWIQIHMVNI